MNQKPITTKLANTAVDTEKTAAAEQQPTQNKFEEIEKSVLLDKAVQLAAQADITKQFCRRQIFLDTTDCLYLADILENYLITELDCNKQLTLNDWNRLMTLSRAIKLAAKTAGEKICALSDALHSKDFSKIKEYMPYVKD